MYRHLLVLAVSALFLALSAPVSHAAVWDMLLGTSAESFTIDNDGTTSGAFLGFGSTGRNLTFDANALRFVFSHALRIEGNNSVIGRLYLALNHTASDSVGELLLGRSGGSWESLAWDSASGRFTLSDDLNVNGDILVNGTKISASAAQPSFSRIKLLPQDFVTYGEQDGQGGVMHFGAASLAEYGHYGLVASVELPEGYKAVSTELWGSTNFDLAIFECALGTDTCTAKGTGSANTLLNHTDITATSTNFLSIIVDLDRTRSGNHYLYGGYVTLEPLP